MYVSDVDRQRKFVELMYNAVLSSLYSLGSYLRGLPQLYHADDVRGYLLARVDRLKETVKLSSSIGGVDLRRIVENIAAVTYGMKIHVILNLLGSKVH